MDLGAVSQPVAKLDVDAIDAQLKNCPRLPSLSSINSALRELLDADQSYTSQISDVIRRDPSLTSRLLRLVNSVYYGITTPVKSIEEAVFYLGVRQIRQLAMVTPVIEDFQKLAGATPFPWREFWQHCIGIALLTGEVIAGTRALADEADYVAGLVHDVGKITMAAAFPAHFVEVRRRVDAGEGPLLDIEAQVLGMNHATLGAMYLRGHNLPEVMIEAALYHHAPHHAQRHPQIVAAVHVSDLLIRHANLGASGNPEPVSEEMWLESDAWAILFPSPREEEREVAQGNLKLYLDRLPSILEGLV